MERPIVLIVDDEPLIAAVVAATLEDAGFEVFCSMTAEDAMQEIDRLATSISALVTDIRLGAGPNGWAVAVDARTALPLLPVVYTTGDSGADWAAFGVPESVLVQKPFVGAQVLAAITSLMNSNNTERTRSAP
jgi:DNA-binding response OmpR family regulator